MPKTTQRNDRSKRATRTGNFDPIPKEYAKPYRKTAYLLPYPTIVNSGILYKEHGRRYGGIIDTNQDHAEWLRDLRGANEISFSDDRVVDARSKDFYNPLSQ